MFRSSQKKEYFLKERRINGAGGASPLMGSGVGGAALFSACLLAGLTITSLTRMAPADDIGSHIGQPKQSGVPANDKGNYARPLQFTTTHSGDTANYTMTASEGSLGIQSDSEETITALRIDFPSGLHFRGIDNPEVFTEISSGPSPTAPWLFGSALLGLSVFTRKKTRVNNRSLDS